MLTLVHNYTYIYVCNYILIIIIVIITITEAFSGNKWEGRRGSYHCKKQWLETQCTPLNYSQSYDHWAWKTCQNVNLKTLFALFSPENLILFFISISSIWNLTSKPPCWGVMPNWRSSLLKHWSTTACMRILRFHGSVMHFMSICKEDSMWGMP